MSEQMRAYQPRVDDYRIAKATDEGKHWIWRFEIDGRWVFVAAKNEQEAGDFVAEMDWIDEDDRYDYWR